MSLLNEVLKVVRYYGIHPKKRLGQNFLVDSDVLDRLVKCAMLTSKDIVLEIGAGLGFLTEVLAGRCGHVIAVEIDSRLVKILKKRLSQKENVSILHGNILTLDIPRFNKVVSTPPYSISSPLLFWLLERKFELAVLTFQKEFADRLTASVNDRNYSRLTVTASYKAYIRTLDYIPKDSFWPVPEVDSIIVEIKPREEPPFKVDDERFFFKVVNFLFSQKNKKVRNSLILFLRSYGLKRSLCFQIAESTPFQERRVRELAPEDLGLIANVLIRRMREVAL
ncbi:TPA: ribosomal RNA small subunit methyltransferase A [Candidatus Bathyarchaeota archaeon]|nr:ribosomal RNA small subunit methyltransferase A [Candidatus Bathyarchaeota archaeon]